MCEPDLVKVAVRGHVGVHGGLSHCRRPQELSSVFVIHEQLLPHIGMLKFGVAFESLIQMSSIELVTVCISTNNITYTCHVHASYCALHLLCLFSVCRCCSPSVDVVPTL